MLILNLKGLLICKTVTEILTDYQMVKESDFKQRTSLLEVAGHLDVTDTRNY